MSKKYVIAIDPDVDKSGFAMLNVELRRMAECTDIAFPQLLDYLYQAKMLAIDVTVYVEAGWLITHNWHLNGKDNKRTASAKGNAAGRNHEVGRKIVEMCKHYGLPVQEVLPLRKCWKGKDGKITQEEIAQFIPCFPKKTNQEVRDAALLAWHMANLPIRINPTK